MLFTCILRSFNWTTVRYIHLSDRAIQACYHLARKLLPALRGQMPFWSSRRFELQAATSLLLLFSISTLRDEASDFTVSRDPNSAHSRDWSQDPQWCANLPWFVRHSMAWCGVVSVRVALCLSFASAREALAGLPFVTATVVMRLCEARVVLA